MCRHHARTTRFVVILMLGMVLGGLPATAAKQNSASTQDQGLEQDRPFPPDTYALPFLFRGAVDRSPGHYLAALVEIASDDTCEGTDEKRFCTSRVKVIDLLAARVPEGWSQKTAEFGLITSLGGMRVSGRSWIGSRLLVVVIPSPIQSGLYEATAMISSPSKADVEHARHEVERLLEK